MLIEFWWSSLVNDSPSTGMVLLSSHIRNTFYLHQIGYCQETSPLYILYLCVLCNNLVKVIYHSTINCEIKSFELNFYGQLFFRKIKMWLGKFFMLCLHSSLCWFSIFENISVWSLKIRELENISKWHLCPTGTHMVNGKNQLENFEKSTVDSDSSSSEAFDQTL